MRSVVTPSLAAALSAVAWNVQRDLHRARTAVRLDPPAAHIAVEMHPTSLASGAHPAPTLRVAALGDSAIAGIGVDRVEDCLAAQTAARVADTMRRSVRLTCHGVSGARTADVTATQVPAIDPRDHPDAVLVVVGANDIVHTTPPWRYARAVTELYLTLRGRIHAPVVACSLPEIRAITIVGHPLRDVAAMYGRLLGVLQRRAVERLPGVTLVDARRAAGPAFLCQPDAMAVDGFHPSRLGYALLADALAPAVIAAITRRAHRDG